MNKTVNNNVLRSLFKIPLSTRRVASVCRVRRVPNDNNGLESLLLYAPSIKYK